MVNYSLTNSDLLQPVDEDSEWAFIRGCFRDWKVGPILQLVSAYSIVSLFPLIWRSFFYLLEVSSSLPWDSSCYCSCGSVHT